MERQYEKQLNPNHNSPRLVALVRNGVVVEEWVYQPGVNWRDGNPPWGTIGLTEPELRARGFRKVYKATVR